MSITISKKLFKVVSQGKLYHFEDELNAQKFKNALNMAFEAKVPHVLRGPDHPEGETF